MMKQIQDAQNSFHSSPISETFHSQALIQEAITNRQHSLIETFDSTGILYENS